MKLKGKSLSMQKMQIHDKAVTKGNPPKILHGFLDFLMLQLFACFYTITMHYGFPQGQNLKSYFLKFKIWVHYIKIWHLSSHVLVALKRNPLYHVSLINTISTKKHKDSNPDLLVSRLTLYQLYYCSSSKFKFLNFGKINWSRIHDKAFSYKW